MLLCVCPFFLVYFKQVLWNYMLKLINLLLAKMCIMLLCFQCVHSFLFSNPLPNCHLSIYSKNLCAYFPRSSSSSTHWIFLPLSLLLRIEVHFAAGQPVGCFWLAEPSPDLVVLPAECQRALGQWAVWTTPPGPLWAPVWPRDRWV